jgi:hypothetical protein
VLKPPQLPNIFISIPLGTQLVEEVEQDRVKHKAGYDDKKQQGVTSLPGTDERPKFLEHRYVLITASTSAAT